jgi:hypothetical protein
MALILSVPFSLLARLQDCMPPFLGSASGVRGTDETAAAPGSLTTTWTHLFVVLIIVGVVIGGGLNPFGFGVSSSARPRSLCGPLPAARVHQPIKGCWSRPLLADHAELAALEQAQLEAALARRGWRPISRALPLRLMTTASMSTSSQYLTTSLHPCSLAPSYPSSHPGTTLLDSASPNQMLAPCSPMCVLPAWLGPPCATCHLTHPHHHPSSSCMHSYTPSGAGPPSPPY